MSESDDNLTSVKIFFAILFMLLMSMYNSCSELRISLVGKSAVGNVEQVLAEVNTKTKEETGKYIVHYNFLAEKAELSPSIRGTYHTSRQDAVMKSVGENVDVLYLAGNPDINRVRGHREWFWIIAFFITVAVIAFYIKHLIRPFGT